MEKFAQMATQNPGASQRKMLVVDMLCFKYSIQLLFTVTSNRSDWLSIHKNPCVGMYIIDEEMLEYDIGWLCAVSLICVKNTQI